MLAVVQGIQSLTAAGTASVVFAVPEGSRALEIHVSASAPVTAVVQISHDGSTYVNATLPSIAASAGKDGSVLLNLNDSPYKSDAGPIVSVSVNLTAGAAAAAVVVLSEDQRQLGR
jgi:hypothetical protein